MSIILCFMYLDEKEPGNAQLAPGMVIIHHVVLHSLWWRDPIIFYMEVSQRCFQTILSNHGSSLIFWKVWLLFEICSSRSSRPEVFLKKGVLRNFTKFTRKHLCLSLFFNKVASFSPATLLKNRLWYGCFPVNFVKFLKTSFYIEHFWWLLL